MLPQHIIASVGGAVTGTILVTKALLPGLARSKAADIMTVVSTAGWPGWDFGSTSSPFHAAKHGQSGFSDALRHELKGQGIRVMAIYPPDFDDLDPLDPAWEDVTAYDRRICRQHGPAGFLNAARVGQIARCKCSRTTGAGRDGARNGLQRRGIAAEQNDIGASIRRNDGQRPAKPAAGTGDDHAPAGQARIAGHATSPLKSGRRSAARR